MSNSEIPDKYSSADVESKIYQFWMEKGYFAAQEKSKKPPFSIILPPPNVTGSLHMGHALDHTIQDVLVRWKRMSGFNTLWLPGTDHAGIATQSVVEKQLAKNGEPRRQELGREAFVKKVWDWKHEYGDRIISQMKRLGDSCDWDRHVFTLDEKVSKAVRKVFVELYKKSLVYKGTKLINWSPKLESAISDLEVEYKDVKGKLWHIKYPLLDGSGHLTVATTRPETLLGDTAVCVHPTDDRYAHLVGKEVLLPLLNRPIPIIADEYVDPEFGSGVVKITPAHDFNDYQVGLRHDLKFVNLLKPNGELNENAGQYAGLMVAEARKKVITDLEDNELMLEIEDHNNSVGHCSRTGCVVEPYLSEQWFVKMKDLAEPAKRVVENGTTSFEPESWTKTYLHWMNNIQDWCISRQLWWGHRIPAWHCSECQHVTVSEDTPKKCEHCGSKKLEQDSDVLDTWFSSGLWPFSTLGWPEETETLKTFYPTNVLVTGHDIIFFWVARMIFSGLEFMKDVPFRKVYIHGLIRDSQGLKMSKSLGNSIDPVELIEQSGADALRATLMAQMATGRDLKFSMQRFEGYRNFMNKLWNASRFALNVIGDSKIKNDTSYAPNVASLTDADVWIITKLKQCESNVDQALKQYQFSEAFNTIYNFTWHEFCDWYLEFIKPVVYGNESDEREATQNVLAQVLNRIVRMLHPFTPFITEELYQKLPVKGEAAIIDEYPTLENDSAFLKLANDETSFELDVVREVITAIRNIRGENRIKPGETISARLVPNDDAGQKAISANKKSIMTMAGLGDCSIGDEGSMSKCAVSPIVLGSVKLKVIVPLEGLVDFDEEIKRLKKSIDKLSKERMGLSKRLDNENFVKNAPADVVEQGKKDLAGIDQKINELQSSLDRMS